jgi:hypothetical protein
MLPQDSFHAGAHFRGFTGSQLLRPVRLLASPDESDRITFSATGGFYLQASDGAVTLPIAGYDYDIDWTPMSAGLAPAGMAASFAGLAHVSYLHTGIRGLAQLADPRLSLHEVPPIGGPSSEETRAPARVPTPPHPFLAAGPK